MYYVVLAYYVVLSAYCPCIMVPVLSCMVLYIMNGSHTSIVLILIGAKYVHQQTLE